ncbi:MAG: rRNA pseudouridine synthase [Filimonas sp.]|nr:rRNA pseudouridine synthase [Filimonas sp.]
MGKQGFDKFINQKSGAQKKEEFRREKREIKKVITEKSKAAKAGTEDRLQAATQKPKSAFGKKENAASDKRSPVSKREAARQPQPATNLKRDTDANEQMPLNKFIAHSGFCGRREAAEIVKEGHVTVNGTKIFEPGFKVSPSDKIIVKGKQAYIQRNLVYILVNKPKDYITTAKDPEGRKTIFEIIKGATEERVYPVGRLDRNTTGVLIMTNDGELAQKLTHPSYEIKKVYEVKLDKAFTKKDFEAVLNGITLEDGFVKADSLGYADAKDKSIVGIEIHSGRNRIVRRIFEHLGYDVKNLDRVMFANLTKKNVDRGKWRFLSEKEVRLLKYMNQSFVRKQAQRES